MSLGVCFQKLRSFTHNIYIDKYLRRSTHRTCNNMHIVWFEEFRGSYYIVIVYDYNIIIIIPVHISSVNYFIIDSRRIQFHVLGVDEHYKFYGKRYKKSGTVVPSLLFSANRINNKLHVIIIYCYIVNVRFPKFSLIKFVRHDSARVAFQSVQTSRNVAVMYYKSLDFLLTADTQYIFIL